MTANLTWKKYHPLSDKNAFICLVDSMGDDSAIVQAARVSYGKDERENPVEFNVLKASEGKPSWINSNKEKDRQLIRYLMNHSHTTPFEMVEIKFMVQVPMDCWRQWVRHRTASINEYSTRYTEALDFFQVTQPHEWRLQATDNKQGSSGYLTDWPEGTEITPDYYADAEGLPTSCNFVELPTGDKLVTTYPNESPGAYLSQREEGFHKDARYLYEQRLALGIAKEQARKDLPLSTYTRAYWKCDLHNIFNFLRLRMDSHAQLEIRSFANCMFEIVKQICPVACEAFEDYVLYAKKFSRMEMEELKDMLDIVRNQYQSYGQTIQDNHGKPSSMTDREWKEFLAKLS